MMTPKKKAFIEERAKDPLASNAEIARRAGYSPNRAFQTGHELSRDKDIEKRLKELETTALDTLEKVAKRSKVDIARVQASKVLLETSRGKPKDNPTSRIGNVTININKIDDGTLDRVIESSVQGSNPL